MVQLCRPPAPRLDCKNLLPPAGQYDSCPNDPADFPHLVVDPKDPNRVFINYVPQQTGQGGGIYNNGRPLTLQTTTIPGNTATGTPPPTLTTDDPAKPTVPSDTSQSGRGGGIYNGPVTVQTTIAGNPPTDTPPPLTLNTDDPTTPTTPPVMVTIFIKPVADAADKFKPVASETGTAVQGTSVPLNTQQNQTIRTTLTTGTTPAIPYFSNPQLWLQDQQAFQSHWIGGGPFTTSLLPGQTGSIQIPVVPQPGIPPAGTNFLYQPFDPNVTGYVVQAQGGAIPNFTGLIGNGTIGVGDFNGDGRADILWHGQNDVLHGYTYNPSTNTWSYVPSFTGGVNVALGDVNGDGTTDLTVQPGPGGTFSYLQLDNPLLFGTTKFYPLYAGGVYLGQQLQQFGNDVQPNTCGDTYPAMWDPPPASYAPGSDLPETTLTLSPLKHRAMR